MLFSLYRTLITIIIVPITSVVIGGEWSVVKRPYGSLMCVELCGHYGRCIYLEYDNWELSCRLCDISPSSTRGPYKLKMNEQNYKSFRNLTSLRHGQMTLKERTQTVYFKAKAEHFCVFSQQMDDINELARNGKEDTNFTFDVTPALRSQKCSLLSMAASTKVPNIIYLLVSCVTTAKCLRKIHFLDLNTNILLNNSVNICEREEGDRQIFTGPCLKNSMMQCLFSVNNDENTYITTYYQPVSTDAVARQEKMNYNSLYAASFLCSIFKGKNVICLVNGKMFVQIEFQLEKKQFKLYQKDCQLEEFKGMRDFKSLDFFPSFKAVIVQETSVTVVTLDFDRKKIYRKRTISIRSVTVATIGGNILLHDRPLVGSVYRFKVYLP